MSHLQRREAVSLQQVEVGQGARLFVRDGLIARQRAHVEQADAVSRAQLSKHWTDHRVLGCF